MSKGKDWVWKFAPAALDQFDDLDPHVQDRIVSKLDEIVDSEWREPDDFLELLAGGPRILPTIEYDHLLNVHPEFSTRLLLLPD